MEQSDLIQMEGLIGEGWWGWWDWSHLTKPLYFQFPSADLEWADCHRRVTMTGEAGEGKFQLKWQQSSRQCHQSASAERIPAEFQWHHGVHATVQLHQQIESKPSKTLENAKYYLLKLTIYLPQKSLIYIIPYAIFCSESFSFLSILWRGKWL